MRSSHVLLFGALFGALALATACSSKVTGTGGSSSSSSSGTSGTSGTSGVSSSGTSGVSSSGTSGVSSSGTSGVSSSGTSGTARCGFSANDLSCNTCLETRCCSEAKKCSDSAQCNAVFACVQKCAQNDDPCLLNCENTHSTSAVNDLVAFFNCISKSCGTQCN